MKKIKFKTISSTRISDTVTPVGLYIRFRDLYASTLLLESSDYHSKEESYSFICIEPVVSMKVENHQFSVKNQGSTIFKEDIQKGMKKILDDSIEAQVYFEPSKFGLTLFKNFPNPTASIEDFGIVGLNQFEGDTLLSVKSFDITINLFSLFRDVYTFV